MTDVSSHTNPVIGRHSRSWCFFWAPLERRQKSTGLITAQKVERNDYQKHLINKGSNAFQAYFVSPNNWAPEKLPRSKGPKTCWQSSGVQDHWQIASYVQKKLTLPATLFVSSTWPSVLSMASLHAPIRHFMAHTSLENTIKPWYALQHLC